MNVKNTHLIITNDKLNIVLNFNMLKYCCESNYVGITLSINLLKYFKFDIKTL